MRRALIVVIILTLGLLTTGCGGESEQNGLALGRITGVSTDSAQSPEVGKLAPSFYFETSEGEPSSLSELMGKPVLLNFWATWCGPCAYEMPYLQQFYDERQGEVVLLAINIGESPSQVSQFMQSQRLSFPVLLDTKGEVAEKYGIRAIPTTLLVDKYGFIQDANVGSFRSTAEIESLLSKLD